MRKLLILFLVCLLNFSLLNSLQNSHEIQVRVPIFQREEPIRILAFGDIMMGRYVRVLMEQKGLYYPFKKTFADKEWLAQFDLITGNLEGPVTERFVTGGISMTFGFPPDTAQILKNLGFSALNLGNNHINDRSTSGYGETKKYLSEVNVGYFGNYNDPANSPGYFRKIKGKKIAFLGFNDVSEILDVKAACDLIKKVKKGVDYVIVFPHWGVEYRPKANNRQRELARRFIDAGADLIIGSHPHVVQDTEEYKGKKIFYSLGNFIFDQYFREDVEKGLALGVTITDRKFEFDLYPMKSVLSQPYFVD